MSKMKEYTYEWNANEYDDETKPILKITKSSLGTFVWCPKKYDFNKRQNKPQDQSAAMYKGTVIHNSREDFFNEFDIKKAESLSHAELTEYCLSLHPIDDFTEMYETMSIFEANRFMDVENKTEFLPVGNEVDIHAEVTINRADYPLIELQRDYSIHLQGIIDRIFLDNGRYVLFEFKTGLWKDGKKSSMRKEMAYYKYLIENTTNLEDYGLDPNIPITHWGWYYPASNYVYTEKVKKISTTAMMKTIANLIRAYELELFPTKYFARTCASCSYFGICDAANMDGWI